MEQYESPAVTTLGSFADLTLAHSKAGSFPDFNGETSKVKITVSIGIGIGGHI